jgi:hypothetical protein
MGGLHTDDPDTQIPPTDLKRANNITFEGNKVQKAPGAIRYNKNALSAGVLEAIDWWPNNTTQRLVCITADGNVNRLTDIFTNSVVNNTADATQNTLQIRNQPMIVQGGAEVAGNNRKLFILSGGNPVQVMSGDATSRYTISKPALDWSGNQNQPTAGVIYNNSLWCWGNQNNQHTLYASNPADHEDFQTVDVSSVWPVFPGEGQGILACYVFKGRLFIFKYPYGLYYLDDSAGPTFSSWVIRKYMDNFGAASAHSGITVLNDMFIANSFGTITSANAVQYYGGFDMADVLVNSRNAMYVRENMSPQGNTARYGIYYEQKKQAFFSYRSTSSTYNDQVLYIDFASPQQQQKMAWWNHLQPNCMFLRKDVNLVPRPCYGANDGYIYLMDQVNRDVNGDGYEMDIMTPSIDFATSQTSVMSLPGQMAEVNKLFDFLELTIECTGKWYLNVDVFLDGKFSETLYFTQSLLKGTNEAVTNIDRTYDGFSFQVRKRIHGSGKRIALRFYNDGVDQNISILRAQVYMRFGTQGEKDAS